MRADQQRALLTKILIVAAVIAFSVKILIDQLAKNGLIEAFKYTRKNVSRRFPTGITPAPWTFRIWKVIYIWNGLWLFYALTTVFRKVPLVLPPLFFVLYILQDIRQIISAYFNAQANKEVRCALIFVGAYLFYAMLFLVYQAYEEKRNELRLNYKFDAWCIPILVQNGLMIYAAWLTVASKVSLAIVTEHYHGMSRDAAGTLSLSILLAEVLIWFVVENFFFSKYTWYTFITWPVVLWALAGALDRHWDPDKVSARMALSLAVLCSVLFIARIGLVIRHWLFTSDASFDHNQLSNQHLHEMK